MAEIIQLSQIPIQNSEVINTEEQKRNTVQQPAAVTESQLTEGGDVGISVTEMRT